MKPHCQFDQAMGQFKDAKEQSSQAIEMIQAQVEIRTRQFDVTLRHFASTVCEAYSSVSGFHNFFSRVQKIPGLLPARDFPSESDNRRLDYDDQDLARSSYQ